VDRHRAQVEMQRQRQEAIRDLEATSAWRNGGQEAVEALKLIASVLADDKDDKLDRVRLVVDTVLHPQRGGGAAS
jgi:hypothetical protein